MTSPSRPPLYLVDDDEDVLDSLRYMLESCDERQLFCFTDGERFLTEINKRLAGQWYAPRLFSMPTRWLVSVLKHFV